ncbi:hypothetical protein [Motherwort yellow mottle virus]|uniref:Uncharacterized protein n=1 Tax=Motherwort yellow mottle virus TaxID=1561160 RepID=A0A097IAJ6_9SECO|nr:hypothetical protein CGV06_s2gp1 [Motherwort yellow mottle virus]AIT59086.1 hypothetical protein [Motherwort yellow mottle virus]
MSFINTLDISEEEAEQRQIVLNSRFRCVVSTDLLTIPACVALDFRKVVNQNQSYSYLRVEWKHNFPQPFGFHVLPSGNWNVSGVSFSGALFKRASRLETAIKLLEENKASAAGSSSTSKLRKQVSDLEAELELLKEENIKLKASAAKAKAKLHKLREEIADSVKSSRAGDDPEQNPKSTSPQQQELPEKSNQDLFKSWAGDGNVD